MNDIIKHLQNTELKENISLRRKIKESAIKLLIEYGFEEYDTPVLMPKGGENYNPTFDVMVGEIMASLADSPQIFKMLLNMTGYDKYYQFAHCFRPIEHESNQHTRLCEFTQLDVEFRAETLSELVDFAEKLIHSIIVSIGRKAVIRRMNGIYCRRMYGDEMKPDIRTKSDEISVVIIENMPLTNGERTKDGGLIPCHHIFALPSAEIIDSAEDNLINLTSESFDIVINGIEVGGGDLRIKDRFVQESMMDIFDVDKSCYSQYLSILDDFGRYQGAGFAIGLERLVMALTGGENIRNTVLFPDFYKIRGI